MTEEAILITDDALEHAYEQFIAMALAASNNIDFAGMSPEHRSLLAQYFQAAGDCVGIMYAALGMGEEVETEWVH